MSFPEIFFGILEGLHVTLLLSLYGLAFAVPFAMVFGVLQYILPLPWRHPVTAIIEFWRASSPVILLPVFYFVLPPAGIKLSAMTVGALILGITIGSYGSQIVRGALNAVDRGQIEAGAALGLKRFRILILIEFPQAFRQMLPSFVNELVELIKVTSLVSLITLTDMTFRAKQISQIIYQPVEIYSALLLIYFLINYPLALLGKRLERKLAPERAELGR